LVWVPSGPSWALKRPKSPKISLEMGNNRLYFVITTQIHSLSFEKLSLDPIWGCPNTQKQHKKTIFWLFWSIKTIIKHFYLVQILSTLLVRNPKKNGKNKDERRFAFLPRASLLFTDSKPSKA
jgi:hypothetical protein